MLENLTGWEGIGLVLLTLLLCFWLVIKDEDE